MSSLSLSSALITSIIDDPSKLAYPSSLGITEATASFILHRGYTRGFRNIFILNGSLTSIAVVASALMIKHKELIRGDEDRLRIEAEQMRLEEIRI